ncbi:MAG TPA: FecR domain-containing protein [Niabella sp.]
MDKKLENKFYRLFALKLSGEATAEALQELEAILVQHPELRFFYDEMIKPAQRSAKDAERAELSYAAHAANMYVQGLLSEKRHPHLQQPVRTLKRFVWPAAAALLVIAMLLVLLLNRKPSEILQRTANEMATAKGSRSSVRLPDGTVVLLNANSRLNYDEKFKGASREVSLSGEAYFDVAHDAAHPFIIHTNAGSIKVLGTAFNVKALDNGFFETTLIRGKVAIQLKNHSDENFVLKPGQKLVASKNNADHKTDSVMILPATVKDSLVAETSWTKGQLVFVDRPLVEITAELARVFGVTIVFKSDKTKQFRYTGVFDDTDLDQILEILKLSQAINYHRDGNRIIIE